MTARTVVGTVVLPGGVVPTHATVMIELVASTTGRAIGWVPTADLGIAGRRVLECDSNGAWSVDLRPNTLISPSGTYYRLTYTASSDTQWSTTFTIVVPDSAGPHRVEDILDPAVTPVSIPALQAHIDDTTAAHAASAVSFTPTGTIAASDVQAAVAEVASEAASALSAHEADTTSVHGMNDTAALPYLVGVVSGDATAALQTAAASGRSIMLTRGATYVTSAVIRLNSAGQVLYGNGATIQRRAQIVTTLTSGISSGVTVLPVASTAGFAVGQQVSVSNAAKSVKLTTPYTITAVGASSVTLNAQTTSAFSSGDRVFSAWHVVELAASDCAVQNLIIDGNIANWGSHGATWETCNDILVVGDRGRVTGCRIYGSPGEAILMMGDYGTVSETVITGAGGNGIHLSNVPGCKIVNVTVDGCNLGTNIGHEGGCIAYSQEVTDLHVSGCYLANTTYSGIGGWAESWTSDVTIVGNTFRNCTFASVEGQIASGSTVTGMTCVGNRIYDCGRLLVSQLAPATTPTPGQVVITGNYLINSGMTFNRVDEVVVNGNMILWPGNTTTALIDLTLAAANATVTNNHVLGGSHGIFASGDAGNLPLSIVGNTVRSPRQHGISFSGVTNGRNVLVQGNTINLTTAAMQASGCIGINACRYSSVVGNSVRFERTGTAVNDWPIVADSDVTIVGNTLRGGDAAVRIFGGTSGASIQSNSWTVAASIGGTHTNVNNVLLAS